MKGLLRKDLRTGYNTPFYITEAGQWVEITDTEEHIIFGTRYKILGHREWFEANCFEEIKFEEDPHAERE